MSQHRISRPRRRRAVVLLTALTAAVALVLPTTGALAAKSAPPPPSTSTGVATALKLTLGPGLALPAGSRAPAQLYSQAQDLTVTVNLVDSGGAAAPYSTNQALDVALTVTQSGSSFLAGVTTVTVPGGGTTATFAGLRLKADNRVRLTATVVSPRKAAGDIAPDTGNAFDVVLKSSTQSLDNGQRASNLLVTAEGAVGVPCTATPEVPTCVDVLLPNGVGSDVFFSTGTCTGSIGCRFADRTVLQVLADLGVLTRYPRNAPATLVVKCDKTLCGGGAIQRNVLQASLDPIGDLRSEPACGSKGVVVAGLESCVDYVQSKRDGSGDTYLFWLVTRDARFSI